MSRDATIATHCSRGLKRDIADLAAQRDQSVSELVRELLKKEVHEQNKEDVVRETKAEERIEAIVSEEIGKLRQEVEEFKNTARNVQETTAKTGVYTVGLWELSTDDVSYNRSEDALSAGSRRLREDLLEGVEIDEEALETAENGTNSNSASELFGDD